MLSVSQVLILDYCSVHLATPAGINRYSKTFFRQFVLYCLYRCTRSLYHMAKVTVRDIK